MSPEMDLLDTLCGESQTLDVVLKYFPDLKNACKSLRRMVDDGMISISSPDEIIPAWKLRAILTPETVVTATQLLVVAITEKGIEEFGS